MRTVAALPGLGGGGGDSFQEIPGWDLLMPCFNMPSAGFSLARRIQLPSAVPPPCPICGAALTKNV